MAIPYVPQGTSRRFRVPKTLAADFDKFLENDIPNTVMDLEVLSDWYTQFENGYEPRYIRGEVYPDSTKSRYENTDNIMNLRCSVSSGIKKGDMVIEPDNEVYILDWNVHLQSNNAPSRMLRCNMMLNIERFEEAEVDDLGYVRPGSKSGNKIIVDRLPCNAYRYDGRPEDVTVSGTPGQTVNALTLFTVQYNNKTKNIRIDDKFTWGDEVYYIVDINRVGIDIFGSYGTLKLQAKKKPGGLNGY
jgi:hypothetical protein